MKSKIITNYKRFILNESVNYSSKGLIIELCVSMILLNNEFLDNILDKGMKARYTNNSRTFLLDLKNLLLSKNRLKLGKFIDDRCQEDSDIAKATNVFDNIDFDIEKDWSLLSKSRDIARSIIDKLLPGTGKLDEKSITSIYWLGPNKDNDHKEDIVIELANEKQYSFFLDKTLSSQKTASFNKFADDLIGQDIDRLFSDSYIGRWNKLTQRWVQIIYENINKKMQSYIEEWINPNRIDILGYFDFFDIEYPDPKYKILGKFIPELDKNILTLSDLLGEIWKKREEFFIDVERVQEEWYETKVIILNSKILENLLSTSLKNNFKEYIVKRDEDNFKIAEGTVKMKLFKTIVEKMDSLERDIYFIAKRGEEFYRIPERNFFRKYYDDIQILFDYHVPFTVDKEEDNNDFNIKIKLLLDNEELMNMNIIVQFSGKEMSGKLNAKYKFELSSNFNYNIYQKENAGEEVEMYDDDNDVDDVDDHHLVDDDDLNNFA